MIHDQWLGKDKEGDSCDLVWAFSSVGLASGQAKVQNQLYSITHNSSVVTCVPVKYGSSLYVLARSGDDLQYQIQEVEGDLAHVWLQHPCERIVWAPELLK